MLGQKLDFDPGQRYAYSNYGYCLLGRVIEKLTGQSYEAYVQDEVLVPLGITSMRIGATLRDQRHAGEVRYYHPGRGPLRLRRQCGNVRPTSLWCLVPGSDGFPWSVDRIGR